MRKWIINSIPDSKFNSTWHENTIFHSLINFLTFHSLLSDFISASHDIIFEAICEMEVNSFNNSTASCWIEILKGKKIWWPNLFDWKFLIFFSWNFCFCFYLKHLFFIIENFHFLKNYWVFLEFTVFGFRPFSSFTEKFWSFEKVYSIYSWGCSFKTAHILHKIILLKLLKL